MSESPTSRQPYEPPQIIHEETLQASAAGACSSSWDGMGICRYDMTCVTPEF